MSKFSNLKSSPSDVFRSANANRMLYVNTSDNTALIDKASFYNYNEVPTAIDSYTTVYVDSSDQTLRTRNSDSSIAYLANRSVKDRGVEISVTNSDFLFFQAENLNVWDANNTDYFINVRSVDVSSQDPKGFTNGITSADITSGDVGYYFYCYNHSSGLDAIYCDSSFHDSDFSCPTSYTHWRRVSFYSEEDKPRGFDQVGNEFILSVSSKPAIPDYYLLSDVFSCDTEIVVNMDSIMPETKYVKKAFVFSKTVITRQTVNFTTYGYHKENVATIVDNHLTEFAMNSLANGKSGESSEIRIFPSKTEKELTFYTSTSSNLTPINSESSFQVLRGYTLNLFDD